MPGRYCGPMDCKPLPLQDALLLTPAVFSDDRGYFKEVYAEPRYAEAGITDSFLQDNVSVSRRLTLRGLHSDPKMAKLVQVLVGEAFDVIVDLRKASPTHLKWAGVRLTAESHQQIYIPRGFLHGLLALTEHVVFSYKQSALYDPSSEVAVAWDDPDLAIEWPLEGAEPLLSPKDSRNPTLRELGYLTQS